MYKNTNRLSDDLDSNFKIFHELMIRKVNEILLVSSLYDACIMEEDGRLSERIIHEYRGLNLSKPPRITWVSSAEEALARLSAKAFDLVITMPRLSDMDAFSLGQEIKTKYPELPVIMMTHSALASDIVQGETHISGIDKVFVWFGNTDILMALIKNLEDQLNVIHDTETAGVRVILFVEDSPIYASVLLPVLYQAIVLQVQEVLSEGLNEEHRLLTMRARPKILHATTFEEAKSIFSKFERYILGVISDVQFPHNRKLDPDAGITLLSQIRKERFDIPLLLTSSETSNRDKAENIPASFIDKNSQSLLSEVRAFFIKKLGFGDFVFRTQTGREIGRASNFRTLEKLLPTIPYESFYYHWRNNDFSRWLFARSEIQLASRCRPLTDADFGSQVEKMRHHIIDMLRSRRKLRQKGVVVNFDPDDFDPETEFMKIGKGSIGGKARSLTFMSTLLRNTADALEKFVNVNIFVPKTLVMTTEVFDSFIEANDLISILKSDFTDEEIWDFFQKADFPEMISNSLRSYLEHVRYPLAVRSSGLLEDAQFTAYAGLYCTYLISNDSPDLDARLEQLVTAIKGVYASTYLKGPKSFAGRLGHRIEDEKMAVIIQQLIGKTYRNYFYPTISGVARSHNYYPVSHMKIEDGIVNVVLGIGQMLDEEEKVFRFCPKYPQILPQHSTVNDILQNNQRFFYALKMGKSSSLKIMHDRNGLETRLVDDAIDETPVMLLSGTYIPAENRIRDTFQKGGNPILTFAQVLKFNIIPLADILTAVLEAGYRGVGWPVEIEFSANINPDPNGRSEFALLQIRPMSAKEDYTKVDICIEEIERSFCYSTKALGNKVITNMTDIIYVKPDKFDPAKTVQIAQEIGELNSLISALKRKYLLIGPGRWGSADRWLGIPVSWDMICSAGAIVETSSAKLKADFSQGSHFFHKITTLGITYANIAEHGDDFFDWSWLTSLDNENEAAYVAHVVLDKPFILKVDGRASKCVMVSNKLINYD